MPLGLQFSILAIGIIVMQSTLVSYDIGLDGIMVTNNPAQNGFGAANKLSNLFMTPLNGLGAAIVSFNAVNFGANKKLRVRKGMIDAIIISFIMYIILGGGGLLLTINGAYQYLFLSPDKITALSIKYGNYYLYVSFSCFFLVGLVYVLRSGVQGIGKSQYTLIAGIAELVARILVCTFLPILINGEPINANASDLSFLFLSSADPFAWLFSVLSLLYPFIRYILIECNQKIEIKIS